MSTVHFSGVSGEFDYDNAMYKIVPPGRLELLRDYKGPVDLPHGCISCNRLFEYCDLTGCYFRDFDTSKVIDMSNMFSNCRLPKNFSLGDKFDTSNVEHMCNMFWNARLLEGFSLGESFNTSNVYNMSSMFEYCAFPEGFTLGSKFDTSKVKDMTNMFCGCVLPAGFSLGSLFNTANVKSMRGMFSKCALPAGFNLNDKFCLDNVLDMTSMFDSAVIPKDFKLDSKLYIHSITKTNYMFAECEFLGRPWLHDLSTEQVIDELMQSPSSIAYDYSRIVNVPIATLQSCKSDEEYLEITHKFCKV